MESTPQGRLQPGLLGRFGIAGAVSGAAVVLVLGTLFLADSQLATAGRASLRSAQILELAATAERLTADAETSTRAFLLTGRAQYAREAHTSYDGAEEELQDLAPAVANDPEQRQRVAGIQATTVRLGRLWLLPSLANKVGAPQPYAAFVRGERARAELQRRYAGVVASEQSMEGARLARLHMLHRRVSVITVATILAIPALLVAFLVYVGFALLRPVRALADLAVRVEQGEEGAVGEVRGPREIAQLQQAFNRMSSGVAQRRREILDHAPIVIWEVVGGELRWISPFWRAMAGETAREPRTVADVDSLVHPEDREQVIEIRRQGMETGQPYDYRYRLVRPDGQIRWLWTTAKPMGMRDGQPRVIGFTLDVTDDERLRQELTHAQRLESVGHLASGVAHDFNNLLTVIAGYATLAQMRRDDPSRLDQPLAEIMAAAERASALTRQLLMFSREQAFELQLLDLNDVVRGVMPMFERLIEERILLLCSLADRLPPIRFDRGQLEQVLVNLAVNARDAISGTGRIVIGTSASDQGVRISVSDDGTGMDDATIAHIFDPFFTTKPPGEGTGLGLSTVHGIVARGGGHIEVDSRPGAGTTFVVCLPAASDVAGIVRGRDGDSRRERAA